MGHRSIQKYLYDIQQSILSIEEYLGEKRDFIAYEQNKLLRRAVERELEIIGEAMAMTLHELWIFIYKAALRSYVRLFFYTYCINK